MIQVCPLDVDFLKKYQPRAWIGDSNKRPPIGCQTTSLFPIVFYVNVFPKKFDYYGDDHPFFYYLCYSLFCLAEFNEKVKSRPSHSYPAFIIVDLETDFVA